MKTSNSYLFLLLVLCFAAGCEDDDITPSVELDVPATYSFSRGGESTVSFSGQTTRIAMAEEINRALLDPSTQLEQLNNMFRNPEGVAPFSDPTLNESTKAVRPKVAAGALVYAQDAVRAAAIREDFDGWLVGQVNEVFPAWNELAAPGQPGQIADGAATRYVNGWGLEYDQAFVKSLIGALMVDQMSNNYLTPEVLDGDGFRAANDAGTLAEGEAYTDMEHRWDEAYGYLFGGSPTPETPLASLGTDDSFLNKYLGRMEGDPDYAGLSAELELAFRTGRQAIVQRAYEQRDAEAKTIMDGLDKTIAVRAVYYLKQAEVGLRAVPAQYGPAFHDLSEGYGFIYSLRFLRTRDGGTAVDWYEVSEDLLTRLRNEEGTGWWDIDPDLLDQLAREIADATGISVAEAAN